jgi:F0F1-type ATP synthase membrane subunit a
MQGHETDIHHAGAAAEGAHHGAGAAHAAGTHAEHAEHAAHELPNFITVLNNTFPDAPWAHFLHRWENVIFSLLAAGLITFTAVRAAQKKSIIPQGIQNVWEAFAEGIEMFVTGILGEKHAKDHVPYLGTVFIYILLMNWSGLIPLFKSPTASWGTTLAVALATLVYVQWTGITKQGPFHYLKHMAGNPSNLFGLVLVPLMLIINLSVEFVAVPLVASFRQRVERRPVAFQFRDAFSPSNAFTGAVPIVRERPGPGLQRGPGLCVHASFNGLHFTDSASRRSRARR